MLWPAGDPTVHRAVGQYGDIDNSISKFLIMNMESKKLDNTPDYFNLAFGKRSEEELYDIKNDPYQLNNLAMNNSMSEVKRNLRSVLENWMEKSKDPRFDNPNTIFWDTVEYVPKYQFENFDLEKGIEEYTIGYSRKGIPCL